MKLRRLLPLSAFMFVLIFVLAACASSQQTVFHTNSGVTSSVSSIPEQEHVPWDYRIVEGKVGDLIGSDMTILPDNQLLPNDNNYATGDKVWTLQFMDAELTVDHNQRNSIQLSSWSTLKSYKTEAEAKKDLDALKILVTTEVDLIGVYKTEYEGKTRNFAVLKLPSGNTIKQPIDDNRYKALEKEKTAEVVLEEVHDFSDYDLAFAKFRGWAN